MRALSVIAVLWLALPWSLQARSLHWQQLEVEARLDSDGQLHMVERHTMVFDGEHNGGERVFDYRPGATLELEGIRRFDPTKGKYRALRAGDLSEVDHFALEGNRLRWRSRLPSDPPFDRQTLIYEIEYRFSGIVVAIEKGGYLLEHDFLIRDRPGSIEQIALDIRIDPPWRLQSSEDFELDGKGRGAHWKVTGGPKAPGDSHFLSLLLTHHGKKDPVAVQRFADP